MSLRTFRRTKDGKLHVYWGLVESARAGGRTRQRGVCCLGDLEAERREAFETVVVVASLAPALPAS